MHKSFVTVSCEADNGTRHILLHGRVVQSKSTANQEHTGRQEGTTQTTIQLWGSGGGTILLLSDSVLCIVF